MVRKLTIILLALYCIHLLLSCSYKHKNSIRGGDDMDCILREKITKIYKKKISNEEILMAVINDTVVFSPLSIENAPHRTKISLCFTDDMNYFMDYEPYGSLPALIHEMKKSIWLNIQKVDENTISLTMNENSMLIILPSLIREILKIQTDRMDSDSEVYLFVYPRNRVAKCIPPAPPLKNIEK